MSTSTTPTMGSPLSTTYMPHNALQRSPSNSSLNTRQRSEFETSQSSTFDPDSMDCDLPGSEELGQSAHEMPFASEPALEGELEQELPPLKKLKPNGTGEEGSTVCELGVKSILARKTSGDSTPELQRGRVPSSSKFLGDDLVQAAVERRNLASLTPLSLDSLSYGQPVHPSQAPSDASLASRPMSRRSSSGASSSCGSNALKAVRFASGNGFSSTSPASTPTAFWTSDDEHSPSSHDPSETLEKPDPVEVPGPVAAVVYLTHSREAYDRSPIVVDGEGNLSLPPRERKEGERGWIKCGKKRSSTPHPPKPAGGSLVDAAGLDHEAKILRQQKEKLRQEIEALGRAGLGSDSQETRRGRGSGSGVSPLLRNIGLSERSPPTEAPTRPSVSMTSAWAHDVANSCGSGRGRSVSPQQPAAQQVDETEAAAQEDPNTIPPLFSPDEVNLDEVVSDVGDENPGDALSDDGSVGSDADDSGYAREHEEAEPEPRLREDRKDDEEDDGLEDDRGDDEEDADEDQDREEKEKVGEEDDDEEEVDPEEEGDRRRRRQMGMCGLGKWTREDVYSCDALGGF